MARATKPTVSPPDLGYVIALKTEMEALYGKQDEQIDRMRRVRNQEEPVDIGRAKVCNVELRDATIRDELARIKATFTVDPPTCRVTPAKADVTSAQQNATLREHFSEAVLDIAGRREAGDTTWERCVDAICADGGACSKFLYSRDLWDNRYAISLPTYRRKYGEEAGPAKYNADTEEAKQAAGPPFVDVHVDIRSAYPVFRGRRLMEVLEIQDRPFSSTFRQYRLGFNKSLKEIVPEEVADPDWRRRYESTGAVSTVQFLELWDAQWATYVVYGGPHGSYHILRQWEHGYGEPPYFFAMTGIHSEQRNRKIGESLSEPKRYLVEALSYYQTLQANVAAFQAMPPMFRTVPAEGQQTMGKDGAPLLMQSYDPGYLHNLAPGEKVEVPAFPPLAESLQKTIADLRADIAKMEPPRLQQVGDESGAGFAIAQIIAENKTKYSPVSGSLQRMLSDKTRFMWKLCREKVGETVYVHRRNGEDSALLKAAPEELTDDVGVEWTVSPATASAKIMDERYWDARVKNGSASIDMMVEALGSNPDEVRQGRAMDRIRATPWYQAAEDAAVLSEIGRGDLLQMQQAAQQIAQTGAVPPSPGLQGTPTSPGEPGLLPGPNGPQAPAGVPGAQVPDFGRLAMGQAGNPAPSPVGISGAGGFGPNVGGGGVAGGQAAMAQSIGR